MVIYLARNVKKDNIFKGKRYLSTPQCICGVNVDAYIEKSRPILLWGYVISQFRGYAGVRSLPCVRGKIFVWQMHLKKYFYEKWLELFLIKIFLLSEVYHENAKMAHYNFMYLRFHDCISKTYLHAIDLTRISRIT